MENPRLGKTLGTLVVCSRNYNSPDIHKNDWDVMVRNTGRMANNSEHHKMLIKKTLTKGRRKIAFIYNVTTYQHSAYHFYLGDRFGFDYSNNGFYIVTESDLKKYKLKESSTFEDIEKIIQKELNEFSDFVNGYECELV